MAGRRAAGPGGRAIGRGGYRPARDGRLALAGRAQIDGDNVRIQAADLPRELGRRLARRAIGTVRAATGIESPAWSEGSNIEKLLESLSQGSRATQAGVIASVRSGVWRFRPAPPRKTG